MKALVSLCIALGMLLQAGCSSVETSQDYDKQYDFSTLKTYQWLPEESQVEPSAADFARKNPLIDERIRKAVDSVLDTKGYTRAASGPDFYVTYHVNVESKIRSRPSSVVVGSGYYGRHGGWAWNTGTDIYQYDQGRLVIDILDAKRQLVWRGVSTSIVTEHESPENITRTVNEMVDAVLTPFPPGSKSDSNG